MTHSSVSRASRLLLASLLLLTAAACGGDDGGGDGGDQDDTRATGATCPTGSTLTYESFGKGFMDSYCTSCHAATRTGAARGGAPTSHNYDTVAGVWQHRADIDAYAAAGPNAVNTVMPNQNPRPTEEQRRQLGEWLACGAP